MASSQKQAEASQPPQQPQKKPSVMEEDDEFEDFPVEDWGKEETEQAAGDNQNHLWEESWDDDDPNEDFSKQLKEEILKVNNAK